MNRVQAYVAVHRLIRQWLDESVDFDEQSTLQALGLDKEEIEWLLWRLEDRFNLCVSPRAEQRALWHLEKVEDLVQWLLEQSRQDQD